MNHYITSMFGIKIFLPLLCICLSSCVYFNTFYNAENSFKQANEIIDNSSNYNDNTNDIPTNAKKLLKESILSSNIVISDFSDSKYVDDAIYYMARSYFSLSEFYKSQKYFNDLINNYPNSKYYNECRLWLEYTHLKLNILDSVLFNSLKIEEELISEKNKDLFFLLYNLKGDFYIQINEFDKGFNQFEKALEFVNSKSKKTMLYSKLAYISESENMFEKSAKYLEMIQLFSNNEETKIDAFRKWLDVMKKLNRYDEIILKIQNSINSSEFESQKLKDEFNMELAIAYMNNNSFDKSKNLFNDIIDSSSQRQIKCESYYWLGYISLIKEFDLELAKEYFDLVLETMRTSDFSKKTKQFLNEIKSYNKLLNEYESNDEDFNFDKNDKIPKPSNEFVKKNIEKDSLLFIIAEKLFFDFNQSEMAINKHKELINIYPSSNYVLRSDNIIKQLEGLEDFELINKIDTLKVLRDSAWNLFDYNKKKSIDLFLDIATRYNDYQSYYSLGIIYEDYLYQPDLCLKYYLESFNSTTDDSFRNVLKNKLLLLEESIKVRVDTIYQNENYVIGYDFLITEFNLDSSRIYFNKSDNIKQSKELEEIINRYTRDIKDLNVPALKDSLLNQGWQDDKFSRQELDSIFLDLANMSFWYFKNLELSKDYLDILISDSSIYSSSFSDLRNRINSSNFSIDSSNKNFNSYFSKSENYFNYYNSIKSSKDKHKEDLEKYNNLLYYISKNLHDNNELDTLNIEQIDIDNIRIINNGIPNINGNKMIPVDIDIKINNE